MAALPVGKNHHAGPKPPQHRGDLQPIFEGVLHVAVGQIERLAMRDAQDLRGGFGLGSALFGGATRAGLAARQVEDPSAPAKRLLHQKSAAAGLLDVIAMRGDGKYVERTCGG